MKLYIAGPMTGYDDLNFPAFHQAKARLIEAGYEVVSPADRGGGEMSWAEYMKLDLKDMLDCDGIALLPGWEDSTGAGIEVDLGEILEMPNHDVDSWIELKEVA